MSADFYRTDQTSSNVKLTYSGSFFNQSFGSVLNELEMAWYWKKTTDVNWTLGGTITPTITGNNIGSATIDCGDMYDYQTNYRFKLEAIDKLSNGNREMDVTAGIPNYSFGEDWFQHHTDVYDKSNGKITSAKELFPIGSVYITVENINPGTFLGGTWTGFGGGRCLVGVNSSEAEFDEPLKTGGAKSNTYDFTHNHIVGENITNTAQEAGSAVVSLGNNTSLSTNAGTPLGSKAISTLQPYIVVYFWRRTA